MRRAAPAEHRGSTGGALLSAAEVAALVKAGYRIVGAEESWGWAVARRLDGTGPRLVVGVVELAPGVDAGQLDRVVGVLRTVSSVHLAAVADAVTVDRAVLVLVAQAPGSELGGLISRRGALTPGEVVTCAVPVLEAVGAVVGVGLGWVGAPVVVVDPLGRPVVQNVWQALVAALPTDGVPHPQHIAVVRAAGAVGGSTGDAVGGEDTTSREVTAQVAAWLHGLLGERRRMPVAAEGLRALLDAAADGRWIGGPTELAAACFDTMAPAPIAASRPTAAGARRGAGHAAGRHGVRVVAAVAGAASIGVGVAMASLVVPSGAAGAGARDGRQVAAAGAGQEEPFGGADSSVAAPGHHGLGPAAAAAALTYRRATVLSDGLLAGLRLVSVPGSAAWQSDAELVTAGAVGPGQRVHTSVTGARTVARSASRALVDVWSATWVGERPAISVVRLDLVLTPDGWRAVRSSPVSSSPESPSLVSSSPVSPSLVGSGYSATGAP